MAACARETVLLAALLPFLHSSPVRVHHVPLPSRTRLAIRERPPCVFPGNNVDASFSTVASVVSGVYSSSRLRRSKTGITTLPTVIGAKPHSGLQPLTIIRALLVIGCASEGDCSGGFQRCAYSAR
jgi:hypothetical protein